MNTEPRRIDVFRSSFRKVLKHAPIRLAKMLYRNWPWKLLALFLAVCLWAGLITQDPTLTRERVFSDVPLTITGADSLRRNSGLIVLSGLEKEDLHVRLRVDVPQREYNSVTASNYNPRVDLTRITEPGEQTIRIAATSTTLYGSVQSIYPDTIDVVVDEYVTNYRVPVSVNLTGSYPYGYYGSGVSLDPSVVAISGPRSIIDQIARVVVDYDVSTLSAKAGKIRTARTMRFEDKDGVEISKELLEVTSADIVLRTITLEQTLYPTRMLPLNAASITTGTPAKGYQVKNVTFSPSLLKAAGEKEALDAVESLFADNPVDLTGVSETFTATVRVKKPAELAYLSADTISVMVEIEPVIVSDTFNDVKLSVIGTGSALTAKAAPKRISILLSGPQPVLDALRASDLTAYVDAAGLDAGEYELPVQLQAEGVSMEDITFAATPATATVLLQP